MTPNCRSIVLVFLVFLSAAAVTFAEPGIRLRGKWVLDQRGQPVPAGSFRRGLQPSGLVFRDGALWCVGDQRSLYPGHVFRIDPNTGRMIGEPMRFLLPEPRKGENPHFATYRSIRFSNPDFEGLAADPRRPDRLFAVTEDKTPWIATVHLEKKPSGAATVARLPRLAEILLPDSLTPWRDDTNFRFEGIAISDDAKTVYLAFERADDNLPRLCQLSLADLHKSRAIEVTDTRIRFEDVPFRPEKGRARLNLNDIHFVRWKKRPTIVGVARDQERILVIDVESRKVRRWVDLDLRDPDGNAIYWVSPEGLALDKQSDKLWIINDPDSVRGNYKRRDQDVAGGLYAAFAPLLFETKLSKVLEE